MVIDLIQMSVATTFGWLLGLYFTNMIMKKPTINLKIASIVLKKQYCSENDGHNSRN